MAGKQRTVAETLTGDRILTAAEFKDMGVWDVTPGAARNVDLPVGTTVAGQSLLIRNAAQAAHTITVRLTSGGATVATVDQNESALVFCHSGTVVPTFTAVVLKVGAT